jgi:hypothetical protein
MSEYASDWTGDSSINKVNYATGFIQPMEHKSYSYKLWRFPYFPIKGKVYRMQLVLRS